MQRFEIRCAPASVENSVALAAGGGIDIALTRATKNEETW
jgi:hypothetical protein